MLVLIGLVEVAVHVDHAERIADVSCSEITSFKIQDCEFLRFALFRILRNEIARVFEGGKVVEKESRDKMVIL